MKRLPLLAACVALSASLLAGCGGSEDAPEGEPLASEACGFLRDAGKILVSNDPPSEKADVLERAVDKAVKVAHRAKEANPDYSGLSDAITLAKDAVESGDSKALASAIKAGSVECTRSLGL